MDSKSPDTRKKIYLKDYQAPDYQIPETHLFFDLFEDKAFVECELTIEKTNSEAKELRLDGKNLELLELHLNGEKLSEKDFEISPEGLRIFSVPDKFKLKTKVKIEPQKNLALEGLYRSRGLFVTQCEARGFHRITYFLDRPDVMSRFQTRIQADKAKFPVLLSNGNCTEKLDLGERHQLTWHDPFKKPCYLFALAAGDLGVLKDSFQTKSGRKVSLEIYSTHGTQNLCSHAMDSLKKAMQWDEERFGREYDLDSYMIVAVDDFNAGAMENKGLNIFNSVLVFADPKTATDDDYYRIESVIGHEYFHNWTGNRITVRDWFHLSLKEGLTVFRDQEFSMDQSSRAMVRIDDVKALRSAQFAEDAGPNAHPIRPESCYAVDNFYTATIYEKGAEVIRMMQTMVGRPGFRKGMDLYFERHDGQAVIIEDFAAAIADANGKNWELFKRWYWQAGTPRVEVKTEFDPQQRRFNLTLKQSCPPTPNQSSKDPFHIPLALGLVSESGQDMDFSCKDVEVNTEGQKILNFTAIEKSYHFDDVAEPAVLSLNRSFSAPIILNSFLNERQYQLLLKHDSDSFNRWEAAQTLHTLQFQKLLEHPQSDVDGNFLEALMSASLDYQKDPELTVRLLTPPSLDYLVQLLGGFDAPSFEQAKLRSEKAFAEKAASLLLEIYQNFHGKNEDSRSSKEFGKRRLKNFALAYLARHLGKEELAYQQLRSARIMTDQQGALAALVQTTGSLREQALGEFFEQWKDNYLVTLKWFGIQAVSSSPSCFADVVSLWDHPSFDKKNPNMLMTLLRGFGNNLLRFHDPRHDTYQFMAEKVAEIDSFNPMTAARIASVFNFYTHLKGLPKENLRKALENLMSKKLSANTYEIVSNVLKA